MPQDDRPARSRAAEAFRALDAGADLAKRRAWREVERGIKEDRLRRRRRLGWIAGIAAGAVAALTLVLPPALDALGAWYEPSQQEEERVVVDAVMEMLGRQQAHAPSSDNATGMGDFAQYLVTEAHAGAE